MSAKMSDEMVTNDISSTKRQQPLQSRRSTQTLCSNDGISPAPCEARDADVASIRSESSEPDYGGNDMTLRERWGVCLESMRQHDETMVKRWMDDIDSLLVFAGLFSAILTAFTIEFYRQLQYDPEDTTVLLLQQISLQLALLNTGSTTESTQNFTLQSFASPNFPFTPPSHAVRMTTTWFAALVCSLVAALIGILAKQWLREYITEISSSPRESVRIRQFRHDGLTNWHVAKIIGFLPILLEIALVLFLHGLLELLWTLNTTVASVSTAVAAMSLVFYVGTMVIPAFSPNSPFKAPQAWAFYVLVWKLRKVRKSLTSLRTSRAASTSISRSRSRSNLNDPFDLVPDLDPPLPLTWSDREVESGRLVADELDQRALARTYKRSLDEDFLDIVSPCLNDLNPDAAVSLLFDVVARRGDCSVSTLLDSVRNPNCTFGMERYMLKAGSRGTRRLMCMILDVLPRMVNDGVRSRITILDLLYTLRKLLTEAERAVCESALHRRALDTLAALADVRSAYHVQRLALDILSEMTQVGCNMDYCPNGIQNVIFCAQDAHSRKDHKTFVSASSVLLGRLPASQNYPHHPHTREWLQHWISNLEQYFRLRKRRRERFDAGIQMKWCSGLAAVAGKEKELVRVELVVLLEEGVKLGLVDCDLEEGDALCQLRREYRRPRDRVDTNGTDITDGTDRVHRLEEIEVLEGDVSDYDLSSPSPSPRGYSVHRTVNDDLEKGFALGAFEFEFGSESSPCKYGSLPVMQ